MIDPRVKTQANHINYSSRALKWDILCICSLNTFGVAVKCEKDWFSNFCVFVKKLRNHYTELQKMLKFKNWHLLFLIIFPILFELQRCTVPHFKALEE